MHVGRYSPAPCDSNISPSVNIHYHQASPFLHSIVLGMHMSRCLWAVLLWNWTKAPASHSCYHILRTVMFDKWEIMSLMQCAYRPVTVINPPRESSQQAVQVPAAQDVSLWCFPRHIMICSTWRAAAGCLAARLQYPQTNVEIGDEVAKAAPHLHYIVAGHIHCTWLSIGVSRNILLWHNFHVIGANWKHYAR